jgi:hypothetical protein
MRKNMPVVWNCFKLGGTFLPVIAQENGIPA